MYKVGATDVQLRLLRKKYANSLLASLLTMDLFLKVVIGHSTRFSGRGFAPTALDLCIAVVGGSAPYLFKAPVGEEFLEEKNKHGEVRSRTEWLD